MQNVIVITYNGLFKTMSGKKTMIGKQQCSEAKQQTHILIQEMIYREILKNYDEYIIGFTEKGRQDARPDGQFQQRYGNCKNEIGYVILTTQQQMKNELEDK